MASSRTIEITVQNDTGVELSLTKDEVGPGKWLNEPNKNIGIGRSDRWKAGNKEWAWIGVAGKVTYQGGNAEFTIKFDHPIGWGKTTVDDNATGEYDSKQENVNLQQHHATCTIMFYRPTQTAE